ncbi:unnamed protein product, partial [Mesorhabditis belari]|uniref:CYtochrome P450 family n=1 Tax=Mesorhabditis belari TaxID=2138241 RepID=A0AAF3ES14_9BILA
MIIFLSIFAISVYFFHLFYWKRRNLPPGPIPYPFVGNMMSVLTSEPPGYEAFIKWKKQFGSIYTYWLGPFPAVIIADYELIKETIIKDGDKYTDRFTTALTAEYRGGDLYGVIESSGDSWREMRRFTLHTLRDFGMGKNLMEEKIMNEVTALLVRLEAQKELSPQWEIDVAVGSIINNILFGYRFDEEKQGEFRELKSLMDEHMKLIVTFSGGLVMTSPWAGRLPYIKGVKERMFYIRDRLFTFFRQQIEHRKKTMDYDDDESADLVECFLKQQRKHEENENGDQGYYSMKQLENVLMDLWDAGMETTSNTLSWGLVYVLNDLEVQKKIHDELDFNIKSDRLITLADKKQLPYLNATINEIQRLANLLPVNIFRKTTEDVTINGYNLPRGTTVIPQISTVMYDEKLFPSPHSFKPERFLNEDGSLRKSKN